MLGTKGTINQSIFFRITDLVGAPLSTLQFDDTLLTCYYARLGEASVEIPLVELSGPDAPYVEGGFIAQNTTYQKGIYRLDLPDAVFATGVAACVITLASPNIAQVDVLIQLDANPANLTHVNGEEFVPQTTVNATVTSIAANAITATSIAADAITAAKLAAGALAGDCLTVDGKTLYQALSLICAVLLGKSTGADGAPVYRDMADVANRVSATVVANRRTAVTLTPAS